MSSIQMKDANDEFIGEAASDEGKTMPLGLGMGDEAALDPLANAGGGTRFKAGHLVIVFVVAVGAAGLWFMRTLSHVGAATVPSSDIERTIDDFLKAIKGDSGQAVNPKNPVLNASEKAMIEVLKAPYTEHQVSLDNVQRNPFILYNEPTDEPTTPGADPKIKQKEDRRKLFEATATQFQVKSVLMSSEPLANVSGKIVRKGDEISPSGADFSYRVVAIMTDGVMIVAEDSKLELTVAITLPLKRD